MEGWWVRDEGQAHPRVDQPLPGVASQGAGVFLGRCVCTPQVWLELGHREPPRLQPHPLQGPRGPAGLLLGAFELLHEPQVRLWHGMARGDSGDTEGSQVWGATVAVSPPRQDGSPAPLGPLPLRKDEFGIPPELRPRLHRVALEVGATCREGTAWGRRGESGGDEGKQRMGWSRDLLGTGMGRG